MPHSDFNLVSEPWITVLTLDGHNTEYSLAEVFTKAPQVRDVRGDLPTQNAAILRLLLAIVHRAVDGPRTSQEWAYLRQNPSAAAEAICTYLNNHRDRFDLFHPDYPFYQVSNLTPQSGSVGPIKKIIADVPDGEPYLTMRGGYGALTLTPAEAARWVLHAHTFDTSGIKTGVLHDPRSKNGKSYPNGVSWCGNLGGLYLVGENLWETIILNATALLGQPSRQDDLPPWERPPLGPSEEIPNRPVRGIIDIYTWQSRRILLSVAEDTSQVMGVVLTYGDILAQVNMHAQEPMSAWRLSAPQAKKLGASVAYMPKQHDPSVQMWRNLASLLAVADATNPNGESAQPGVLIKLAELRDADALSADEIVRTRAFGISYGTQSSSISAIVDDSLEVRAEVLRDPTLEVIALDAVAAASACAQALGRFAQNLSRAAGAGRDESSGPYDNAKATAYAALDQPFRHWLRHVSSTRTHGDLATEWQRTARDTITALAKNILHSTPTSAYRGRIVDGNRFDVGLIEVWFRHALAKALPRAQVIPEPARNGGQQ